MFCGYQRLNMRECYMLRKNFVSIQRITNLILIDIYSYPILILKRDINKVMGFPYNISVSPYKYWICRLLFAVDKKRGTSTQILIPLINAYFKRFYAIL